VWVPQVPRIWAPGKVTLHSPDILRVWVPQVPRIWAPGRAAANPPSSRPQRLKTTVIPTGGGALCRRSGGTPAFRRCLFLFFAVACSCSSPLPVPAVILTVASQNNRHPNRSPHAVIPTAGGALCRRSGGTPAFRRCLFLFFAVACSCRHSERVFRARRTPMNPTPPQPSAPFSPPNLQIFLRRRRRRKGTRLRVPNRASFYVFAFLIASTIKDAKIILAKPQQIPLSSPSTPKNPHNHHSINHLPKKNSWHSSYAPLDTLNIWIKSIEGQL